MCNIEEESYKRREDRIHEKRDGEGDEEEGREKEEV